MEAVEKAALLIGNDDASMLSDKLINPKPKKRDDIQCLRALAIAGVLGFHLRPLMVPQGYLGVDIFFVISGYLMTSILKFGLDRGLTVAVIEQFYSRRIKRIFPVYLVTVLLTLLVTAYFLLEADYDELKLEAKWALGFATNFHTILEHETYFHELSRFKFFLHTWSLAVEIQYYLIAPFLLFLISRTPNPIVATSIPVVASWFFQSFVDDVNIAFNLPFARLWQFLVGTTAYYLEPCIPDAYNSKVNRWNKYYSVSWFCAITVAFMPALSTHWAYMTVTRTIATALAGVLLVLGTKHSLIGSTLMTRLVAFTGDASYSVYLVHWPLIVLAKYLLVLDQFHVLCWFGVIALLSVLQYQCFEKVLQRRSSTFVWQVILVAYATCIVSFFFLPQVVNQLNSRSLAIRGNEQVIRECLAVRHTLDNCTMKTKIPNDRGLRFEFSGICQFEGHANKGSLLVVGNSFAAYEFQTVLEATRKKYADIYVMTQSSCMIFRSFNPNRWHCNYVIDHTLDFLKTIKPDTMIVIQRLSELKLTKMDSVEAARNDSITNAFRRYLELYSNYTNKIVMVEPHPTLYGSRLKDYLIQFNAGQPLDQFFLPRNQLEAEIDPGWMRVQAAMDTCSKCSAVQIRERFCHNKSTCDIYDPATHLTYFCNQGHVSTVGVKLFINDILAGLQ